MIKNNHVYEDLSSAMEEGAIFIKADCLWQRDSPAGYHNPRKKENRS